MIDPGPDPSCHDLVGGLVNAGVTAAFISPGSRNTPITLAVAACDSIADYSIRDERSAGFMALGLAKATGRPAVVACTSGSAATHYFPAIVEADQAGIPMVVLTADRPVELRGTFAPQTMDQLSLYGTHVKASIELDVKDRDARATAEAIVRTATNGIPGPVHVNLPFDEPLTPRRLEAFDTDDSLGITAIEADTEAPTSKTFSIDDLVADRRVLIVTGGFLGVDFPNRLGKYADALGAPVVADAQSRPAADSTMEHPDLLASAGELDRNPPDVIIRFGALPTSKAIWQWLSRCGIPQVLVNRSRLTDPLGSTTVPVTQHPIAVVSGIPEVSADRSYLAEWKATDSLVRSVVSGTFSESAPTEPLVARTTVEHAPTGSIVFVGSSMPIRDVDSFAVARSDVSIIGNRGVNGIDGTISTALGCALSGRQTTVLVGDVAALHDVSALAEVARSGAPLRVVIVNNDGGGIFSFLPQKQSGVIPSQMYEKYWGTPHGLSLALIAETMGLASTTVTDIDRLASAVSEPIATELIEIHTNRDANVDHHRALHQAAQKVLEDRAHR